MQDLKPAHEVILAQVAQFAANLKAIDEAIDKGGVTIAGSTLFLSPEMLGFSRNQDIGAFTALLNTLQASIIPVKDLPKVIDELKMLDRNNQTLSSTIKNLTARMNPA